MTKEERKVVLSLIAKNRKLAGANTTSAKHGEALNPQSKQERKAKEVEIKEVISRIDKLHADKQAEEIRKTHRKSGYTDFQRRADGSFESNSR